ETRRPTAAANGREEDGGVVAAHGRKEKRGGGWARTEGEEDGWGGCCANGEKGKETVETVGSGGEAVHGDANLDRAAAEGQRRGLAVQIWTAADLDAYGCFAN
ncbi:hypothetical protein CSA_023901, partial [Cucumis sativus]